MSKRDYVLGVRMADEELSAFRDAADKCKLSPQEWLRQLARRAVGLGTACDFEVH